MLVGILAGLATCALWGLSFVAPRAVEPFTAFDLAVARYGIFGAASLLLLLHPPYRPAGMPPRRMLVGLALGGAGYVGYFVSVAHAVKLAGAAIPPLVIGTMPVVLAVIANGREGAVPWRALAPPLAAIAAGVLVVNLDAASRARAGDGPALALGIAAAVAALAIWVVYGLVNAAVMRAADAPDGMQWTVLQGIGAALGSTLLLPLTDLGGAAAQATGVFWTWAAVMGLAGSWLATWFWVVASRRLPLALGAQLIVAETVFALVYGFLFEARWPSPAEFSGCVLQIAGVAAAVAVFARSLAAAR